MEPEGFEPEKHAGKAALAARARHRGALLEPDAEGEASESQLDLETDGAPTALLELEGFNRK